MQAWADCNYSTENYNFPLKHGLSVANTDLSIENIDEIEGYSLDTEYVQPTYNYGYSKTGSSLESPIILDKSLVYVVKPKADTD